MCERGKRGVGGKTGAHMCVGGKRGAHMCAGGKRGGTCVGKARGERIFVWEVRGAGSHLMRSASEITPELRK